MEQDDDNDVEEFPIAYSIDNLILMHRDAHFGGDFAIMLDYYKKNGLGISMEFDTERIQEVADTQHAEGKDLSPLLLSGAEAERVEPSDSDQHRVDVGIVRQTDQPPAVG